MANTAPSIWTVSEDGDDSTCQTSHRCKSIGTSLELAGEADTIRITPTEIPYQECQQIPSYRRTKSVTVEGYNGIVKINCTSFAIFIGNPHDNTTIIIKNVVFYNSIITAANVKLVLYRVILFSGSWVFTSTTYYASDITCSRIDIQITETIVFGSKICHKSYCYGSAGISIRNCLNQQFYMRKSEFINARLISSGIESSSFDIFHSKFGALSNKLDVVHGINIVMAQRTRILVYNTTFSHAGDNRISYSGNMAAIVLQEYQHNVLTADVLRRVEAHVTMYSCKFMNNLGGILSYGTVGKIEVINCDFLNNTAKGFGAAVRISTSNTSLHLLEEEAHSETRNSWSFRDCRFTGNEAKSGEVSQNNLILQIPGNGGAVYAITARVVYDNCTFKENKASQFGGALFVGENSKAFLYRTVIINSHSATTSVQGELIFSRGMVGGKDLTLTAAVAKNDLSLLSHEKALSFLVLNLQVKCPVGARIRAVYGMMSFNFKHTSNMMPDLLYHYCFQCDHEFYSLKGGTIQYTGGIATTNNNSLPSVWGSLVSNNITCLACEYGGRCEEGTVRAKPNFWGYRVGDAVKFVSCPTGYCCLTSSKCLSYNTCNEGRTGTLCGQCLKGYSETLLSMNCLKDISCKGKVWFWPAVAISGLVYIFVFFLYKDKIKVVVDLVIKELAKELKWFWKKVKGNKKRKRESLNESESQQTRRDSTMILLNAPVVMLPVPNENTIVYDFNGSYLNGSTMQSVNESNLTTEGVSASYNWQSSTRSSITFVGHGYNQTANSSFTKDSSESIIHQKHHPKQGKVSSATKIAQLKNSSSMPNNKMANTITQEAAEEMERGLMKIIFYFFQVASLLKITVDEEDNSGTTKNPFKSIELTAIGIFNFNFGFVDSAQGYCPFPGLNSIRKLLLKCGFVIYMYLLFVILYGSYIVVKNICGCSKKTSPSSRDSNDKPTLTFNIRLLIALLDIMTYSYQTIADASFKFLHCVSVGDKKVLFIDGSVKCFMFYQYIAMIYSAICIFPFFLIFIFGPKLLRKRRINKTNFLLSCIFPLPFLAWWFVKFRVNKSKDNSQNENTITTADSSNENETAELLRDLESPFRYDDSGQIHWEGVLIGRRLILLIIITFVNDPIPRLFSLFTICTMFLAHHVHVKPFKVASSNNLETTSLTVLVLLSGMNLVHATFIAAEIDEFGSNSSVIKSFHFAESLLNIWLIILAVVGLTVAVLLALGTKIYRRYTGQSNNSHQRANSVIQVRPIDDTATKHDTSC